MRAALWGVIALAVVAALVLVFLSPLVLQSLGKMLPLDVEYLSKVGSSYGAISAILSGLALCFLAAGSGLQLRQTRITQLHAVRSMQLELLRISLSDPVYRGALGGNFQSKSQEKWQVHAYLNLWTMHFQMAFLTGAIEEAGVRAWARNELFDSHHGRKFWEEARPAYRAEQATRRHKRFFAILEDELREKLAVLEPRRAVEKQTVVLDRASFTGSGEC